MPRELDPGALDSLVDGRSFDAHYYACSCGRPYQRDAEWLEFFGRIADRIVSGIGPRRVLDVGCALGLLVETLRARGIDAFGIDVSAYAIEHVHESVKAFCQQRSATDPLGEHYDVIVCIEVLEHMRPADADAAIAQFCAHAHDILFSSSPFDFRETTHANVRPPEYWAAQFARHGFYRDLDFDASFITSWAVLFRRQAGSFPRMMADYERAFSRASIERNELRGKALQMQAEIAGLTAALETVRVALAGATDTVRHMQRSWFWQARRPWAWIRRRIGGPT